MNHPLTDEVIEQNFAPEYGYVESDSILGVSEVCHGFSRHDLRAAADWQLEECVEELKCLLSIFGVTGVIKEEAVPTIVELFKSNMRPQEES